MKDRKEEIEQLLIQRKEWMIDCLVKFVFALEKEIAELKKEEPKSGITNDEYKKLIKWLYP